MRIAPKTTVRTFAVATTLLAAPLTVSRGGIEMNDAQCMTNTCCPQPAAECCITPVCQHNRYDKGIGPCP